jgi:hypothetical protein
MTKHDRNLPAMNTAGNLPGISPMNEREAAFYLKQKPRTLRLWRHTRGLPFVRITSKVILYQKADIDEWLARRRIAIVA